MSLTEKGLEDKMSLLPDKGHFFMGKTAKLVLVVFFFLALSALRSYLWLPLAKAFISDRPISGRARIIPPISDSYKPYPMPMPSRVYPLPTRFVSPAETTGKVSLIARTSACGQLYPYSGSFTVCRGKIEMLSAIQSNSASSCRSLTTDIKGYGQVSLTGGHYVIRPPKFCPPGYYCIMQDLKNSGSSGNLKLLIADPFSWKIEPANFFLSGGEEVKVSATGYSQLLMCPIQAEVNN